MPQIERPIGLLGLTRTTNQKAKKDMKPKDSLQTKVPHPDSPVQILSWTEFWNHSEFPYTGT